METFIAKHADKITATLSGFDRLVFRGTLRFLACHEGLSRYLLHMNVLLKDFASYAQSITDRLRAASQARARGSGRPIRYLASSTANKEEIARGIAADDDITDGLICILTCVEPCQSFEVVRDRASCEIHLAPRLRKCLFLYHYQIHPVFGFMHARIQTWFPFAIQVCLNGRSWLARSMDAAGLRYVQRDNCFTWLEDPVRAQQLMDAQLQAAWPELLNGIAWDLNPLHEAMFRDWPIEYYWSTYQSEWATDLLFRDRASLSALYPHLVHHGLTTFCSPDVLRFLGRKVTPNGTLPPRLRAAVTSDLKHRPEGVRIKHRLGENSIKMYDKQGRVLRVETTINDVGAFKTFRAPETRPDAAPSWQRMRKGIADLHRRSEVSQAANERYLRALAAVDAHTPLGRLAGGLCRPVTWQGRRVRALNPFAADDGKLLAIISRGEFTIAGFRNRDLRQQLFADADASKDLQRRHAAAVSRKLTLLRAHGLIKKVQGMHRYQLTNQGRITLTALITARNIGTEALTKLAA